MVRKWRFNPAERTLKKDIKRGKIDLKAVPLLNKRYTESFSAAPYFWASLAGIPLDKNLARDINRNDFYLWSKLWKFIYKH